MIYLWYYIRWYENHGFLNSFILDDMTHQTVGEFTCRCGHKHQHGHIDNENDVLKLTHALTNGFAVLYFKMIDYKNANVSAMNDYMQ